MRPRRVATPIYTRMIALGAMLAVGATSAHAGLILSPLGGFTEFSSGDDDVVTQSLGSNYSFFGQSFNSVSISTNGNLNFSGNTAFANVAFPSGSTGSMIAPLWADFVLVQNSRIIYSQGNGYFGVTWNSVSTFFNQSQKFTFQTMIFNQNENYGGFSFHAGDIAFAYGTLGGPLNSQDSGTVGLNNSNGTKSAGLPTTGQTLISSADFPKLEPFKTEFILYRYNGTGYDVSYQHLNSSVPEPGTMAAMSLAALGYLGGRRKRKA